MRLAPAAQAFAVAVGFGFLLAAGPALAQSSCGSFQALCAKRCKERAQNPNCVSEVCGAKLAECRSTGCWQEASAYGGKQTCNLKKN